MTDLFHSDVKTFFQSTFFAEFPGDQVYFAFVIKRTFEFLLKIDYISVEKHVNKYLFSQCVSPEEGFTRFTSYGIEIIACN